MATSKKRRLNSDIPFGQPITIQYTPLPATSVSSPIPKSVVNSQTPQELTYTILTSGKSIYKKEEVLTIIGKMDNMLSPKFPTNCDYIS